MITGREGDGVRGLKASLLGKQVAPGARGVWTRGQGGSRQYERRKWSLAFAPAVDGRGAAATARWLVVTGTAGCCALKATGQTAAAAPPAIIQAPHRPGRATLQARGSCSKRRSFSR